MNKAKSKKKKKQSLNLKNLKIITALILVAIIAAGAYFVYDYIREKEHSLTLIIDNTNAEEVEVTTSRGHIVSELSTPEKEGYTFKGWFLDSEFNTPLTERTNIKGISSLYARMDIILFTETFNTLGGSAIAPIRYEYGTYPIEPAYPERANYLFSGWYTEEAATNRYEFDNEDNSDITLYAGWVAVDDALTYTVNSGNYTITGFKAGLPELLIIPNTINGRQVTYVGTAAFNNCATLKKVVISSPTIYVYASAFRGCNALEEISLYFNLQMNSLNHFFKTNSNDYNRTT